MLSFWCIGSGTEKQMIKKTNEKKATEIEAYLWSVAEM